MSEVEPCIYEDAFEAFEHTSQPNSDPVCGRGGGGNNVADDEEAGRDEPIGSDD